MGKPEIQVVNPDWGRDIMNPGPLPIDWRRNLGRLINPNRGQKYLIIPFDVSRSRRELPRRHPHQVVGTAEITHFVRNNFQLIGLMGACNIRGADGELCYNTGRDLIADTLSKNGINYFDPQIWGRGYDPTIDGTNEQAVAKHSKIKLFELRQDTFGGITNIEIIGDIFGLGNDQDGRTSKRVIFINKEDSELIFQPQGVDKASNIPAHIADYKKAGSAIRRALIDFLVAEGKFTQTFLPDKNDNHQAFARVLDSDERMIVIPQNDMCAEAILDAFCSVMKGEKVFTLFKGLTSFNPDDPIYPEFKPTGSEDEMLRDYIDSGTAMKQKLLEIVAQNLSDNTVVVHDSNTAVEQILNWWGEIPNGMKYPV